MRTLKLSLYCVTIVVVSFAAVTAPSQSSFVIASLTLVVLITLFVLNLKSPRS